MYASTDTVSINFCSSPQMWVGWLLDFSQRTKLLRWSVFKKKSGWKTHTSEHLIVNASLKSS